MKARHKDTGEIIELAEQGIVSHDGRRFCWSQVVLIPEPIDEVKPSLPSNLDEAAEEFSDGEWDGLHDNDGNALYTEDMIQYAFKAGAEWMAKQGFISEGIVYQTSGKDTMIELNEHIGYLEDCDEVIVNIRKKEENHD